MSSTTRQSILANMAKGRRVETSFLEQYEPRIREALSRYFDYATAHESHYWQTRGIDFFARHKTYVSLGIAGEYKADTNLRPNIVAEVISRAHYNYHQSLAPGWLLTSQASWLFYGFVSSAEMLVIPMVALRQYVIRNASGIASGMSCDNSGCQYVTYGYLLPIETVLESIPGSYWVKLDSANDKSVLPAKRQYDTLAELATMLSAFPCGMALNKSTAPEGYLDIGEAGLDDTKSAWLAESGQKKLRRALAELKAIDVMAKSKKCADVTQARAATLDSLYLR